MPDTPAQPPHNERPGMQTYQSDLSRAMDTTDATVVQELLATAREKEALARDRETVRHQRGWYTAGGIILILLALGACVYGVYYYKHLTVNAEPQIQIGVFQSTNPLIASDTSIETYIAQLSDRTDIPEGKPFLVPIVADNTTLALLTPEETLSKVGWRASEPFIAALSLVRLGVFNTGNAIVPFLIFSVPNPDIATKEFLIAEPTLLANTAPVLGINMSMHTAEIGKGFVSSYLYNLPVRSLRSFDPDTNQETLLLYYAYATDHTIVLSTNPSVLKAVYDTIIRQQ